MLRHRIAGFVAAVLCSGTAHAQSASAGPYAFGGWSLQVSDQGAFNGVTFGGGLSLTSTLSVEGMAGWYAADSTTSFFSSPFSAIERHTTQRDVPLTGGVRWSVQCSPRVCADVVGGLGVNFHRVTTRMVVTCPPPGILAPCVADDRTTESNHTEFLMNGGLDIRIQFAEHFAIVPGFRLNIPARAPVPTVFPGSGANEGGPYYLVNITALYRF